MMAGKSYKLVERKTTLRSMIDYAEAVDFPGMF